ncbi:hypothetical protein QUW40_09465 [Collinsella tanakaei]|uniref:hypothetical protein n=1 Tax=Collinsella tanakaei TaxID=626935 RepID=UPI0025A4CA61|nr:hypothetical protein [Collinsella tanakaei]MDM8246824.1 hypothetical protein [Collinsella tanakaei]
MPSRKPSARARQIAQFKASGDDLGDLFWREEQHQERLEARRDEVLYERSCARKKRYATRADAQEAIRLCEEHGTRGLHSYKCSYCNGWHLTSHPR